MAETERRYLNEAQAAEYVGLSERALRSLPIPVCRPNRRAYRRVDHVPDRNCSIDWAGAAIRREGSRTISYS